MSPTSSGKSIASFFVNEPPTPNRSLIFIARALFTSASPATDTPRAKSSDVARMIAHLRTEPVRLAQGVWTEFAPSRREKPRTLRHRRVAPLLRPARRGDAASRWKESAKPREGRDSARGQAGIHAPA